MQTPTVRPLSVTARRAYRDAMREALSLGVPEDTLKMVLAKFVRENPDPDDFRRALMQYVPLSTFRQQDREADRKPRSRARA